MEMSEIEWSDPPDHGSSRRDYKGIVARLKQRPGEWAKLESGGSPGGFGAVRKKYERLGCDAVTRQNGEGTRDLYVRWPLDAES